MPFSWSCCQACHIGEAISTTSGMKFQANGLLLNELRHEAQVTHVSESAIVMAVLHTGQARMSFIGSGRIVVLHPYLRHKLAQPPFKAQQRPDQQSPVDPAGTMIVQDTGYVLGGEKLIDSGFG